MRVLLIALIVFGLGSVSSAQDVQLLQREARLRQDFQKCASYFGLPYLLLMAIARQESDCRPYVVNIQGKDHYPASIHEALKLIAQAQAKGQSYDLGLMQINSQWLAHFDLSPQLLLVPRNNIFMGAYILAQEVRASGLSWKAVGHYHSHHKARAQDYAGKIKAHLLALLHCPQVTAEEGF